MGLADEIKDAINRCNAENASGTPDWILAHFLMECLDAFNVAVERRESHYGRTVEVRRDARGLIINPVE